MKKLIKVLAAVLAFTMVFALAACVNPDGKYVIEKATFIIDGEEETIVVADLTDEEKIEHKNLLEIELEVTSKEFITYKNGKEVSRVKYTAKGKTITLDEDDLLGDSDASEVMEIVYDISFDGTRITMKTTTTIPASAYSEESLHENTTVYVKK